MFTCLAMFFYAKVNKRPRISLQQMKKRSSVNRQHDIKICKSCEIVQFWQNQSFLGVVSHFNTKRCGWANCPNPFFVIDSDAELLTQYPSFAVEIKRINNIGFFFTYLPYLKYFALFLGFQSYIGSVAQVLINCFCGIPLYSMVNFMRYSKLISKSNSYNLEEKFVLTCNTVTCLISLSYCHMSCVFPSRGRLSTRNSNGTELRTSVELHMHDLTWATVYVHYLMRYANYAASSLGHAISANFAQFC